MLSVELHSLEVLFDFSVAFLYACRGAVACCAHDVMPFLVVLVSIGVVGAEYVPKRDISGESRSLLGAGACSNGCSVFCIYGISG